jgi:hypothetical protein
MEALVERLEAEAAEKAATAAEKTANDPLVLANAGLSKLWQRAHRAQQKVAEAQARLGSGLHGSFSLRHDLADLKMLNPAPEWFETPPDIGGGPPRAMGLEEADLLAADLSVVADRNERTAAGLADLLSWAEASLGQQNRQLIRALFKRQQYPSDSWGAGE